jgi:hypothetical protein
VPESSGTFGSKQTDRCGSNPVHLIPLRNRKKIRTQYYLGDCIPPLISIPPILRYPFSFSTGSERCSQTQATDSFKNLPFFIRISFFKVYRDRFRL